MKKINKILLGLLGLSLFLTSCKDWTMTEPLQPTQLVGALSTYKTPEYYANLREYKKSDHPIAFGWFGNWTGSGANLQGSMAGLPDSVDVVSMWGRWANPTKEQLEDLRFCQEVKGLKALVVFIVQDLGGGNITPESHNKDMKSVKEYWGWKDGNDQSIHAAIEKYTNALCDTIDKYNYDGFDIDFEPNYGHRGNLSGYPDRMMTFVKTMGKRIGPKAETEKGRERLFVIDGEPQSMPPESGPYFNYFIVQAYQSYGDSDLDRRLTSTINNFKGVLTPEEVAKKYVVTENFENYATAGGVNYIDRYGKQYKSLEGMARWTPIINGKKVQKGGIGTYHMEYEYRVSGFGTITYPYLRKGIQIMNPAVR
ncbi:MAG: glycoside hydrolase family 18 [Bacteroidia bacterium]|nr:glycoside hydrolase family 18 [Bacteroidia bacterium]